jgi:hypothetical protein
MAPCNTECHPTAMVNSRTTTTGVPTKPTEQTRPAPHEMGGEEDAQMTIVWPNVVKFGILHIVGLNGLVLLPGAHAKTMVFAFLMWLVACVVSLTSEYWVQHFEKCGLYKIKFLTKLIKRESQRLKMQTYSL